MGIIENFDNMDRALALPSLFQERSYLFVQLFMMREENRQSCHLEELPMLDPWQNTSRSSMKNVPRRRGMHYGSICINVSWMYSKCLCH